jgi:hypothetical protein
MTGDLRDEKSAEEVQEDVDRAVADALDCELATAEELQQALSE